jgi:hypothetical protein
MKKRREERKEKRREDVEEWERDGKKERRRVRRREKKGEERKEKRIEKRMEKRREERKEKRRDGRMEKKREERKEKRRDGRMKKRLEINWKLTGYNLKEKKLKGMDKRFEEKGRICCDPMQLTPRWLMVGALYKERTIIIPSNGSSGQHKYPGWGGCSTTKWLIKYINWNKG